MSRTAVVDNVLSSGQNEGIERSILPLPQLSSIINARQRKSGRWGKRYGTAALSTTNSSGVTLGNGNGAARCIGPGFVVVDDQCAIFDQQANAWIDPKTLVTPNTTSPICQSPRVAGAVSGWLPDTSFYPVPSLSPQWQQLTPCSQTYGLGYLWSAIQFLDQNNLGSQDSIIRVTAINPTDQSMVFSHDFIVGAAGQGGNIYPKLVTCGATIILTYVSSPTGAGAFIAGRRLTSISGGFGAEQSVQVFGAAGSIYDISSYSATQFLMAATIAGANTRVWIVNALSFSFGAGPSPAAAPATIGVSVVGVSAGPIYSVSSSAGVTTVQVYAANLASITGGVVIDGGEPASYVGYASLLPGGGVRVAYGYFDDAGAVPRHFSWRDVTVAGTLASALIGRQYRCQPISRPITIGTQVYVWITNPEVASGFGYATLLRLPNLTEYSALTGTINSLSCPLEMSAQDFLVRCKKPTIFKAGSSTTIAAGLAEQANGMAGMVQLGVSATYSFLSPIFAAVPDNAVPNGVEFRAIQARHYTDIATARSFGSLVSDRANFLPIGALSRVDQRGAVEEGFVLPPGIYGAITKSGAAGAMSPSVTYQYTALYKSRNETGRFEASPPCTVASIAMGAGDSETFLNFLPLSITARPNVRIEIYRTLGNGSIFYLVDTISGGASDGATIAYNDQIADTVISTHAILPTQVGQSLPNGFPPPSRFGVAGGQRVWLGGLLRNDVIHCSKLVLGDQSPSWADNDAFRIVLPSKVTGLAWMDNLVIFTDEGVYVVSGDGPDDSGNGLFSQPQRLPFTLGCIEPRSVFTVDEGTFFQTTRGLYMVPRGFASPIPAGDPTFTTLAAFPVITGVAANIKAQEQTLRWSGAETVNNTGSQLVYDIVHKCWSVDQVTDPAQASTVALAATIGSWFNGEVAMAFATGTYAATNSQFSDAGAPMKVELVTGDIRPVGNMSQSPISRVMLMGELRSACNVSTEKTTDFAVSPLSLRVFALAAGDVQVGQITMIETQLGASESRDSTFVRLRWDVTTTLEGFAFIGLAVEHEQGEGLKRLGALSRGV